MQTDRSLVMSLYGKIEEEMRTNIGESKKKDVGRKGINNAGDWRGGLYVYKKIKKNKKRESRSRLTKQPASL